ncbi:MAG: glycosyltransferase family 2 protein [Candidatus Shapirobacteria bacterium]
MTKLPISKIPDLTIVIVNYNTDTYLTKCLTSLANSKLGSYLVETIVVDNASTDSSFLLAQKEKYINNNLKFVFFKLTKNLGFSQGNNQGVAKSHPQSRFALFLNPDTTVEPHTLFDLINYFNTHSEVDAATANLILVRLNATQPESHRGFPTPKNAFFHFFLPFLPRLFPKSAFFNGYFLGHLNLDKPTIIDACVGACLMVRRPIGELIGWWCPDYFFYGEDLDFCYQLQKRGFKLWFLPQIKVFHYQGVSSGIKNKSSLATLESRLTTARASTQAMRIFYKRNLIYSYPSPVRWLIWQGINLLEITRLTIARLKS